MFNKLEPVHVKYSLLSFQKEIKYWLVPLVVPSYSE